jgi:hypothetical protein
MILELNLNGLNEVGNCDDREKLSTAFTLIACEMMLLLLVGLEEILSEREVRLTPACVLVPLTVTEEQ